jgi:predicted AlkP superfamily phosphohydrolase/phosphomutase
VLSLALAAVLLAGCGKGDAERIQRKLLIVGVDSADWRLWRPMLDAGRLPHLQQFMTTAASGSMQTFFPLEKSPLLWASINTGMRPEVHGVAHFVKGADQEPVRGSAWGAPALWDILGAAGMSTAVTGMWSTYPARPIDGVMVSDYLPYGREREKPLANLASPDSLSARVAALRVDPASITDEQLGRFIDPELLAAAREKYPEELDELREIWAADLGYLAVNRMLAEGDRFDLFYVYLRGPDMISHRFYRYLAPEHSRMVMQPDEIEIFRHVVERYYEWTDEVLGEVLGWFPPDRQVVVVSDHGFYGPRRSGERGTHEHSEFGVFLVRSPLYAAGAEFDRLQLLDICPTVLALVGLPPASDMPGNVLAEALTADGERVVRRIEGRRITSYMALKPSDGPAGEQDAAVDEELRRQLKALGYIN